MIKFPAPQARHIGRAQRAEFFTSYIVHRTSPLTFFQHFSAFERFTLAEDGIRWYHACMDAIYVESDNYQNDVLRGASLSGAVDVFAHSIRKARRQLMQDEQMKTEFERMQASQTVQSKMNELSRQVVAMQRLVGAKNRQLSPSK